MKLDKLMWAVVFGGAVALGGCESRDTGGNDSNDDSNGNGTGACVGICSTTPDGGTTDGGNTPTDGGLQALTLEQLRANGKHGDYVEVSNLIIHSVSYAKQGGQGDYQAEFWAADESNPQVGIWIEKYYTDLPKAYLPAVGDRITVKGFYGTVASFEDRVARRRAIRSERSTVSTGSRPVELTKVGTGAPTTVEVTTASGFGNAQGGTRLANPTYAGARVHLAGPLQIVDATPSALGRYDYGDLKGYNGFEVTGGVLVNNYRIFKPDAGGCAVREVADGGTVVSFPNGITGVWDTYSHAPCTQYRDGGDCFREKGFIPGVDAGFTFVLYPQSCEELGATY